MDNKHNNVKFVEIEAGGERYNVYTRKMGSNSKVKILLLHGGPGSTYRLFEVFEDIFLNEGYEFYYYDQLGSHFSDKPDRMELWEVDRFVEEVEKVRTALDLNKENFYLFGSSWGGILTLEYALKYQKNLKGLICSSMQADCKDYGEYISRLRKIVLSKDEEIELLYLDKIKDYKNPRFDELLEPYYLKYVLRMPFEKWPEPVLFTLKHLNRKIYEYMNGASEMMMTGILKDWSVKDRLKEITVPALFIGSEYNTMDPKQMKWMSEEVMNGRYHHCKEGSHLAMWDDTESYCEGMINFINDVENNRIIKDNK